MTDTDTPPDGPPLFDFRRPSKLGRDHVRALQIVQEQLARRLTTIFAAEVRVVPQVDPADIEQMTFDDFVKQAEENAYFAIFSAEPLNENGILYMPRDITMTILDRMLGGAGTGQQPTRPLSEIEMVLCNGVSAGILREFSDAMESIAPIRPEIVGEESNLLLAPVMPPGDMCVLVPFTVIVAGNAADITLCFPFQMIVPPLEARDINAGNTIRRADRLAAARDVADRLDDIDVELSVRFNPVMADVDDIRAIAVGDVLELGHPTARPLTAWVANQPTFAVTPGRAGRRYVARVLSTTDHPDQ